MYSKGYVYSKKVTRSPLPHNHNLSGNGLTNIRCIINCIVLCIYAQCDIPMYYTLKELFDPSNCTSTAQL